MNTQLLFKLNGLAGHNAALDKLAVLVAKDLIYLVFLAAAALLGYLLYRREIKAVVFVGLTLVVSFIFLQVAPHLYSDHRPFVDHQLTQLIPHAAGKSFPSDHTTAAAAIALGILIFSRFKKTGWLLLLAAVLIGTARVYSGIHYPVDIAGGLLTAGLGALVTWLIARFTRPQPAAA